VFKINVEIGGIIERFDTLALSAAELEEPLKRFGAYMRKRALARYEAQSFPGLAETTLAKRVQKGLHSLERKLARDVRKAGARAKKKLGGHALAGLLATQTRGSINRLAVLAEFQRRHARQWKGRTGGLVAAANMKPLSIKQAASLDARTKRAVDRAVGKPILGQLTRSLVFDVQGGSMTLRSRTAEGWSNVHNKGGQAGHGAKIPKRETIKLERVDLEVLSSILKSHLLLAFQEGVHGPGF
jgi:phage gpG-like protein